MYDITCNGDMDNVTAANVNTLQMEKNGNEALMERRATEDCRKPLTYTKEEK